MAINVADNFSYKGGKPLDNRTKYSTIASMVATPAADLYDGCLAYVTSTKKNYQYDSTNTVDENLGKWRELQTGGSGEGIPAGGTTGQVLAKKTGADYDVEWVNDQTADTSKCYKYDDNIANAIEDEDYFPYYNISASEKQQSTWTNIKSVLKTYFDQYYGGGGGTSNYNDLTNKPQIAGVTLSGNQSLSSFGLTSSVETQSDGSSTKSYATRGEKYDWNTCGIVYGVCSTSASTTAKSVTVSRGTFNFEAGARIAIKFSYNNTASAPTLTVNSTTKNIKCIDETGSAYTPVIWWNANDIVEFVYDGTQFLMQPTTGMMFKIHGTTMDREDIFSTSEKVVGCWTDGRPIYQKTFSGTFGNTTAGTWIDNTISTISNLKDVVATEAWYLTGDTYVTLPWTANTGYTSKFKVVKTGSTGSVVLATNNSGMNTITAYVTVKYTKTTDSANSFKYGDPNDYSTTEKIVGTWIDGKPLYQKTISCGALPNASVKQVSHGLGGNSFRIIEIQGRADNINSSIYGMNIPFVGNTTDKNSVECWINATSVYISTKMDLSAYGNCYVTIKYTK